MTVAFFYGYHLYKKYAIFSPKKTVNSVSSVPFAGDVIAAKGKNIKFLRQLF